MSQTLFKNVKYVAPISCVLNTHIREYDITKANISVLREKGVLTEELYQHLLYSDKSYREIYIGKLQGSDPSIYPILKEGIIEAKEKFMKMNGIVDNMILAINNDSMSILGDAPIRHQQVSPYVFFKHAAEFTSFYRVNRVEYFYHADPVYNQETFSVKGLGDYGESMHKDFMLDFLKELFWRVEMQGLESAVQILINFYTQYINLSLPLGYYRELNSPSRFKFKARGIASEFYANILTENVNLSLIDISYNEKVLREFQRLLSSQYFNSR